MKLKNAAGAIAATFCIGLTGCGSTANDTETGVQDDDPNLAVCAEFSDSDASLIKALSGWTSTLPKNAHWNTIGGVPADLFAVAEDTRQVWDELYLRAEGDVKARIAPLLEQFADEQYVLRIADSDLDYFSAYDTARKAISSACRVDAVSIELSESWTPVQLTMPVERRSDG